MKNLKHDGVGYVSGRGISKYWGVSTIPDPYTSQKKWCVKFGEPGRAYNEKVFHNFVADGFDMTESMAARIGAYFYENLRQLKDYPNMIVIPWTDAKEIRIMKFTKKIRVHEVQKSNKSVAVVEDYTDGLPADHTDPDIAFYTGFLANAVMQKYLSKKSLQGIRNIIDERLKELGE